MFFISGTGGIFFLSIGKLSDLSYTFFFAHFPFYQNDIQICNFILEFAN